MLRLRTFLLIMLSLSTLIACGPVYKTQYTYAPPRAAMGKLCITQCLQNQNMCEQMCQMRNQTCRLQAHQDALYQYEAYKHKQEREGKEGMRSIGDFEFSSACNEQCGCTSIFNTCYAACGGQVQAHSVCVAFCDTGKKK